MRFGFRKKSHDPESIRQTLQQLRDALVAALPDDLQSLILFGDYVTPGLFEEKQSQVNLMIVLRTIDCGRLDRITSPINAAERRIPLATMTLTAEDIRTSCDVFPVKFHNMQLHHRLLYGEDVLSGLEISTAHLRLRCEQELKNVMIRLRAIYLHQSQSEEGLRQTLFEMSRTFLRSTNACLAAKSAVIPEGATDLTDVFGREFGLDTSVVQEILELRESESSPSLAVLRPAYDRFMRLVHDAAQAIDQLDDEATPRTDSEESE